MPVETRRTDFAAVVLPGVGLGPIRFGALPSEVIASLGTPAENRIDEDGDLLLAYPELGISFFSFDHEEEMRLISYELGPDSDAELWDVPIFQVPLSVISEAAATRGLMLAQSGVPGDGDETLFQIRSQSLDFYFEGVRLSALTPGVVFSGDDTIQWPTAP